jgi:hypothetical protein
MRNLFALPGLARYALANLCMNRDQRRRVSLHARNPAFATLLSASTSLVISIAADVRALGILSGCALRDLANLARSKLRRAKS